MIMQLKFRKYNYMLMQKPVGYDSNEKAPCGRHSKPVTPLGFHYTSEYHGGSRPRLCSIALAGLLLMIST